MTQRELAQAVGVDFTYLSKIENDRLPAPSEATITRLADALDADASDLFVAACKVPRSLKGALASAPAEAMKLLILISTRRLTEDQYRRMLAIAEEKKESE